MASKKILFIEDNKDLLTLVADTLKNEGFEVLTEVNGIQGLETALAELPDLILLDLEIPGMYGLEVLKKLREREDEKEASIPVIIFSNTSDTSVLSTAMEYGVREYLLKSDWELPDLIKKVKSTLNT